MSSSLGKKIIGNTLLNRPGRINEIPGIVTFLASDNSSYITGQTFNVNGGIIFS